MLLYIIIVVGSIYLVINQINSGKITAHRIANLMFFSSMSVIFLVLLIDKIFTG